MQMLFRKLVTAAALASLSFAAFSASAADVEVRCEKRNSRSKASVDGSNLSSGQYRAVLKSGTNTKRSPYDQTVGDEIQFDFDSNVNDIADGATAISANFIVDGRVRGYLVNANNERVTPIVTAICRIRR
jgi:hypothetical protein